ncbi:hypothetical protein L596_007267 [Steinernema carpocapsae]|uniref:Uncharacterized protein n=1 Tax=Steinernema carpocapsae TaxID=34508 RepID=A0A4U5P9S4_STECR|nr:hypothetical protein L596_007267 [Steinernema carpocapsae]
MRLSSWCGFEKLNRRKGLVFAAVAAPFGLSAFDYVGNEGRQYGYDSFSRQCVIFSSFDFSDLFVSTIFAFVTYESLHCKLFCRRSCLFKAKALLFLAFLTLR